MSFFMAMRSTKGNLHLEIQTSRRSPVGVIRTTYRDKATGKYCHTQHGRITGCTLEQLKLLQLAFREKVIPVESESSFKIEKSREFGASASILNLAKELGLHRMLYSRSDPWVDSVMAMVVGRLIYQGSKLSLLHHRRNTCLWELCGIAQVDDIDTLCYQPLDRLLERQQAIQKKLAKRHLHGVQGEDSLLLYDITSTYFQGEYKASELVTFGYNRDRKKGTKQVVIGLICNGEGCPVACEVFKGNTNDSSTVMDQIEVLRTRYALKSFTFVGDRGMVTQQRFEAIRKIGGLTTITALTHGQLKELQNRDLVQMELFDERNIVEITDPEDPELRYCLCKNPNSAKDQSATRKRLIELTIAGLEQIAAYKQATTTEKLGARVGRLLEKYKMGKFIDWEIIAAEGSARSQHHQLRWTLNEEKREGEAALDGCYIIRTDVPAERMTSDQVVRTYKSLGDIERAFRNLKTVQIEIRPVYHKKDDRIRAHVFLCMLSYYVQWHMLQRLQPLFDRDGTGEHRKWTFQAVIERLKQITQNEVSSEGVSFKLNTVTDKEQQYIIDLLKRAI